LARKVWRTWADEAAGTLQDHRSGQAVAPRREVVGPDGELAAANEVGQPEWTLDALAAEARKLGIEVGRSQVQQDSAG
jgi:hypothetical protein